MLFIDSLRGLLWLWRVPSIRLEDRIRELCAPKRSHQTRP